MSTVNDNTLNAANITSPNSLPALSSPQEEASFYNVPESAASNLVLEVLVAGENIADLPERKRQVNHNTEYNISEDGKRRKVDFASNKSTISIELSDIDKLTGSNKPAKKLFVLSLIKANEQAIYDGQLMQDCISFPLQELIDIGFYKTPQSARKGFNKGADTLTSLKIKGTASKSRKKESSISVLEVLFTGARIIRGQCYLYLNNRIDWGFLAQYFTILPKYYFRLPNRASDLLYYIFYLARQNTKSIEERGYFTISFRAIQHRLMLPNEKGALNPQRDIKEAIETAIVNIEDEHPKYYKGMEFTLLPVYDEESNISEYLDNGYLKVSFSGNFANYFIKICDDTNKKIKDAQSKKQRIEEKAIAIHLAKNIKNDNNDDQAEHK